MTVVTPSTMEKAESMPRLMRVKKNRTPIRLETPSGKLARPWKHKHERGTTVSDAIKKVSKEFRLGNDSLQDERRDCWLTLG